MITQGDDKKLRIKLNTNDLNRLVTNAPLYSSCGLLNQEDLGARRTTEGVPSQSFVVVDQV